MKYKNSQTSIEFVILVGFVLFFFTTFFITIHGNMSDKIKEQQTKLVINVASTVQDEINLAFESIDGYYREFAIPDYIASKSYDIDITEGVVYVRTTDNKHAVALPVQNITGQVQKGDNIIRKENGIVKLNV
jgi:hypothetical protein